MTTNSTIRRAVRLALASSAAATAIYGVAAVAQEAAPQDEAAADVGTIVVTGSRIRQPNLTSISPVTSVSNADVKLAGVTRIEDLVNNLPQAAADFGGNLSNGATGAATVNLRGLGAQRTLVLVNGRRLMPGDPSQNGNSTADLNQIPSSLIERIEVLTGGASAVYGADAVAGVVNFIMNDNFEGVRLDAQYSFYDHDNGSEINDIVAARGFATPDSSVMDGYTRDITFLMGMNTGDGRGNATVYAGYRDLEALLQSERDYSACTLNSGDVFTCGGSSTASPPRFQAIDNNPASPTFSAEVGPAMRFDSTGALVPFTGADVYNFGPLNYYQRPDERITAGLFAHYDVSERVQVFTEFQFMNDETVAQIAPSGAFRFSGLGAGGSYIVNCDNPFLTADLVNLLCTSQGLTAADDALVSLAKRNVEGGGRQDHLEHTSYRTVLGARGDFAEAWGYEVFGQYGTTEFSQNYQNDFSARKIGNALVAVPDPNNPGSVACRINVDAEPGNDDPTCVPYNVWQPGGITAEQLGYVQTPGFSAGSTTETIVSGSINGDLGHYGLKLPTATDGLAVAFGAEYRSEESETRNDVSFLTGDLLGQGGRQLNIQGDYNVKEAFVEARLPLVQDKPGAKVVSLEGGYRYSDYNLGFQTDTYKVGADWAPMDDFRLRASFQRAVRAPNIVELFRPQVVQLDGNSDPCAVDNPGVDTPSRTAAECALTGVSAAQYGLIAANPAAQYNGLTGGNPNLDPESSDTYSFGFVLTPRFLEGFSLAVDYYDIKVDDTVGVVGADLILNNCMDTGLSEWCSLINRAPGSGSLWSPAGWVVDTNLNTGSLQTKGIDIEGNYQVGIGGSGRLSFQLIGTMVDELVTEPVTGAPTYDCVGLYGLVCGVPIPEWRHKFRTTWASPWNLDLTLTWRHVDGVDLETTDSNAQLTGDVPATDAKIDSQDYLDLAATYNLTTDPAALTFRLGINNITDEDPPLVGQDNCPSVYCSGNTFPQAYETLGRQIFLSVTADF